MDAGHAARAGRVVALIDMDCFYCACERALQPEFQGIPLAVVQYNPFQGDGSAGESGVVSHPPQPAAARVVVRDGKVLMPSAINGGIIAVSYEARARGVTRFFRGKEALSTCPEIVLVQVPTAHGKSDMTLYRQFGVQALKLISQVCSLDGRHAPTVEKASVDEMYLDLTRPAQVLLSRAGTYREVFDEALAGGTHVAGASEAAEEATRGAQPTGVLARNSFRAGHAGQVVRAVDAAAESWWTREGARWGEDEMLLAAGAVLVSRARAAVTAKLGFTCSAGIAANKLLAKLCGGLHKPDQQTVLPHGAVHTLLDPLPIDRLRGFGGKLGELLRKGKPELGVDGFESVGQLRAAGVGAVAKVLRGEWAHPDEVANTACRMAAGIDDNLVQERRLPKQVSSSKNFAGARGHSARAPIDTREALQRWLLELAQDVADRLAQDAADNGRVASTLVASCRFEDDAGNKWATSRSRRMPMREHSAAAVARDGLALTLELAAERPARRLGITMLCLSAENLESSAERGALSRFLARAPAQEPSQVLPQLPSQAHTQPSTQPKTQLPPQIPTQTSTQTPTQPRTKSSTHPSNDSSPQTDRSAQPSAKPLAQPVAQPLAQPSAQPHHASADQSPFHTRSGPSVQRATQPASQSAASETFKDGREFAKAVPTAPAATQPASGANPPTAEIADRAPLTKVHVDAAALASSPAEAWMHTDAGTHEDKNTSDAGASDCLRHAAAHAAVAAAAPAATASSSCPGKQALNSHATTLDASGKRAYADQRRDGNDAADSLRSSGAGACAFAGDFEYDGPSSGAKRNRVQGASNEGCANVFYTDEAAATSAGESSPHAYPRSPLSHSRQPRTAAPAHVGFHTAGWSCAACTLRNRPSDNRCELCGALRGSALASATALREQAPAGHSRPVARPLPRRGRGRPPSIASSANSRLQAGIGTFFHLRP